MGTKLKQEVLLSTTVFLDLYLMPQQQKRETWFESSLKLNDRVTYYMKLNIQSVRAFSVSKEILSYEFKVTLH